MIGKVCGYVGRKAIMEWIVGNSSSKIMGEWANGLEIGYYIIIDRYLNKYHTLN